MTTTYRIWMIWRQSDHSPHRSGVYGTAAYVSKELVDKDVETLNKVEQHLVDQGNYPTVRCKFLALPVALFGDLDKMEALP
jgi:hypothetical protein